MQRRGSVRYGALLVAIVSTLLVVLLLPLATSGLTGSASVASASAPVPATPADDGPDAPPNTITDFYPESSNLSDCVGLVEKPGCGSGSRGGWRQTVVFVVLFAGLGVILWRVSRGIKANRVAIDADADRT